MTLFVVSGPPAAGKSVWVCDHARRDDIVIDLDVLAAAFTPDCSDRRYSRHVLDVTLQARSAAIRAALNHVDTVDVYIIQTSMKRSDYTLFEQFSPVYEVVDPGRDVVLARIDHERDGHLRDVAIDWYRRRDAQIRAKHAEAAKTGASQHDWIKPDW